MTPTERIEAFVAAWNRRDHAEVMNAFADDIVCHGIPLYPARGKEATAELLAPFFAADRIDWTIVNIAEAGRTVFTERVDRFAYNGAEFRAVRAAGIFELDETGRIAAWRDYFDLGELQAALADITPGALA